MMSRAPGTGRKDRRVGKIQAEEDALRVPGSGSSAEGQGLAQIQRGLEGG